MKLKTRLLSYLLTLTMLTSSVPMSAFALENEDAPPMPPASGQDIIIPQAVDPAQSAQIDAAYEAELAALVAEAEAARANSPKRLQAQRLTRRCRRV